MKKSTLLVFGFAVLSIIMISCHRKRNELVNSWKVASVEAPASVLTDSAKAVIMSSGNLTFTEDGHVTGFLLNPITNGTFALTKGGKLLVIKDEVGTPYPCESEITDDQIVLETQKIKLTLKRI